MPMWLVRGPQFDFDNARFTGEKTRSTKECQTQARGLTYNSLALTVLAELEGPLDEVSGPVFSSLLNSDCFLWLSRPSFRAGDSGPKVDIFMTVSLELHRSSERG